MSLSTPTGGARLADIEAVYRARAAAFMRLARAVVASDEEAWDAVHDAMASAIRSRRSFRGEGSLEAWLCSPAFGSGIGSKTSSSTRPPMTPRSRR